MTPNEGVPRPWRIAVIGAGSALAEELERAEAVGRAIAAAGAVLICGGLGGVMEAAARGCSEAGGLTIGILPGTDAESANPWIRIPLPTGLSEARNALVARTGDAVLAIGGGWGTISEIAFARKAGIPVAGVGPLPVASFDLPVYHDPEEAVAWAIRRRG